jgi:catalase
MADSIAEQLVKAVIADFPDHQPGTRPVHTIGIGVQGYFTASRVARTYTTAAHFSGEEVPVTVRFSNGSGSPRQHDGWSDVRGMATRFHITEEIATDLIMMTLREFFTPTVEDFLAFTKESQMQPVPVESPWQKIADMLQLKQPFPDPYAGQKESGAAGSLDWANHHRSAQLAVFDAANIGAPTSYARATYNAVHTFVVTDAEGTRRHVRFSWQPVAGVALVPPTAPVRDDYLHAELRERLAHWPAKFLLLMTIGEGGDALADPTVPWPIKRKRIVMGTLTLTRVAKDQIADCEKLGFNPCRLVPGISLSEDPILAARRDAYNVSQEWRGATACPFHNG